MTKQPLTDQKTVAEIRRSNIRNILLLLSRATAQRNRMSRQVLCEFTGLTGAGLSRNLQELLHAGLVQEVSEQPVEGRLGRRRMLIQLNSSGAFVIGITIAANRKSISIMNAASEIVAEIEIPELSFVDPKGAIKKFAIASKKLIEENDICPSRILGAGVVIGSPDSSIDMSRRTVSSHALGWFREPVGEVLEDLLNLPVKVVPRPQALLQVEMERLYDSRASKAFLLINCGIGLGAAFQVINQPGEHLIARTIKVSHVSLPNDDTLCYCGRIGCLEQTAGGAGVVRKLFMDDTHAHLNFELASEYLDRAFELAASGNHEARDAFFSTGRRFAKGIDIADAMLQPDQIFVAGEVGRHPDFVRGVWFGLSESLSDIGPEKLSIRETRSAYASGLFALNEFLFSENLDLQFLQSQNLAAS